MLTISNKNKKQSQADSSSRSLNNEEVLSSNKDSRLSLVESIEELGFIPSSEKANDRDAA